MTILDDFAERWVERQKADAELRASLPKTTEEADEIFNREMGQVIHNALYTLREQTEKYFSQGNIPSDAFVPSSLAEHVHDRIVSIQSDISAKGLLAG